MGGIVISVMMLPHGLLRSPSRGWLAERIARHQVIRDDLLTVYHDAGPDTATPQSESYILPTLPALKVEPDIFVGLLRNQASVTVTPGAEFGPGPTNSIRLNFSQDHDAAVFAAHRIAGMGVVGLNVVMALDRGVLHGLELVGFCARSETRGAELNRNLAKLVPI